MRIAHVIVRMRWAILVATIVVSGGAAWIQQDLKFNFSFWTLFGANDPEVVALQRYTKAWGEDSAVMYVALRARSGQVLTPDNLRLLSNLEKRIAALSGVMETHSVVSAVTLRGEGDELVVGPLAEAPPKTAEEAARIARLARDNRLFEGTMLAKNGRTTVISVRIARDLRDAAQRNPVVVATDKLAREAVLGTDLDAHVIGLPVIQWVYSGAMEHDMKLFVTAGVALLMAILLVMFRSLLGMVLPMVAVGSATVVTLATLVLAGEQINMITTVIPTLMMVIGIADGVHILSHHRERLEAGETTSSAILQTTRRLGWACLLTSVTSAAGFASLRLAHNQVVGSFGIFAAVGIMYAFLANILIMPAGLYLCRNRRACGLGSAPKNSNGSNPLQRFLGRVAGLVVRRPGVVLVVSSAVLAVFVFGATLVKIESHTFEEVPEDDAVVHAHRAVGEDLHGASTCALDISSEPGQIITPKTLKSIDNLARMAEAHPAIDKTVGLADIIKQMHQAMHGGDPAQEVIPEDPALIAQYLLVAEGELTERFLNHDHSRTQVWMRGPEFFTSVWEDLRARLEAAAALLGPDLKITVTGASSMAHRALATIVRDVLASLVGATLIIFLLVTVLFRSLRIGVLSMVPNLLPLVVTIGTMGLAGIHLRTSTVVVFSISLGLAVDDSIHFLVRYRRELFRLGNTAAAIGETLRTTGRPIVYTSLLLSGGFSILVLGSFNATRDIGVLGTVTLVTALLANLFVLPALLRLLPTAVSPLRRTISPGNAAEALPGSPAQLLNKSGRP